MKFLAVFVLVIILFLESNLEAKEIAFNVSTIDQTLNEIAVHAQTYPPHFSSDAERTEIEKKLKNVLALLDDAADQHNDNRDILFRDGLANAMGHNLDCSGCAEKAIKSYEQLLKLYPNDSQANYMYGGFLAGTGTQTKNSIPYLEKAISLGVNDAHYSLAFVYITLKHQAKALVQFNEYLKENPDNETAKAFVKNIEAGDLNIQTRNVKQ